MSRVLVVATSRKTRGGITSVIKAHETGEQWKKYHCVWIQTHRDGPAWRKILYYLSAWIEFLCILPFCDVVHFHCAGKTSGRRKIAFANVARKFGKFVIVHFHPPGPEDIENPLSHEIMRTLFDLANKVIVLSPYWERLIRAAYPERNYEIEVLWNPCPEVHRDASKKKKQILFAGTICKRKGYDTLLYGWSMIASEFTDWKVVFAGNGEIDKGKRLAKKLGVDRQVEWLGWISGADKERVFNESSVYCLASSGEGFPMGVLDAWAYGIPCVMTPVGGIPDIAIDGENMLLFNPGDVAKLAECLKRMICDETLRMKIGKESEKLASSTFNVDTICKQVGNLYEELME